MKKQPTPKNKILYLKILPLFLLTLFAFLMACHKENSTGSKNENSFFGYSGNDALMLKTISQLKDLETQQHFTDSLKLLGYFKWDAYFKTVASNNDSTAFQINIPVVNQNNVLNGYINIEISQGKIKSKPSYYSYDKNYISNTDLNSKYATGNALKIFSNKGITLPPDYLKMQVVADAKVKESYLKADAALKIAIQNNKGKTVNSNKKTLEESQCQLVLLVGYYYDSKITDYDNSQGINGYVINALRSRYFQHGEAQVDLIHDGISFSGPRSLIASMNASIVFDILSEIGVTSSTLIREDSSCGGDGSNDGGNGGGNNGTNSSVYDIPEFNGPPINLRKFLNCLGSVKDGPNTTYQLTVYVVEPSLGTGDVKYGLNVGHTFISMTKNDGNTSITQVFGFYPIDKSLGDTPSKVNDNGGTNYDVSETYTLNKNQFNTAIESAGNIPSHQYNVLEFNCTDAAFSVCDATRLSIPEDKASFPMFMGDGHSPGTLGLDLRNQASTNSSINVTGGTAPLSHGECN